MCVNTDILLRGEMAGATHDTSQTTIEIFAKREGLHLEPIRNGKKNFDFFVEIVWRFTLSRGKVLKLKYHVD